MRIPFIGAALLAALAMGCSGGGSGSGSSGVGSSSTAATTTSTSSGGGTGTSTASTGFTGTDTTAPTFQADAASGANTFHTGPSVTLRGIASDAESGVQSVMVNNSFAIVGGTANNATWEATLTAPFGVSIVEIEVVDQQGNVASGYHSIYVADRYDPRGTAVAGAAGVYVTDTGFATLSTLVNQYLTANSALAQATINQVLNLPLTANISGISAQVTNASFGTPTLILTPTAQGLAAQISVPNIVLDANLAGIGQLSFTAQNVDVNATVHVAVANGVYTVTVPASSATVTGAAVSGPSSLTAIINAIIGGGGLNSAIGGAISNAIVSSLPTALQTALNSFTPSYTQQVLGVDFTATAQPTAITYTAQGLEIEAEADITHNASTTNAAPGAPAYTINTLPTFPQSHHVSAALHAGLVNRALFTAWDAGILQYTIDQSFLTQYGINLPFQLDGRMLALFFPPLQALITNPSQPVPVGIRFGFNLPPSVSFNGATPNARTAFGGLEAAIVMDFGTGYQTVLGLDVAGELGADVATTAQAVDVSITTATQLRFDITGAGNPFNLNTGNVNAFLNTGITTGIGLLGNLVPSIPIPAIPAFQGVSVSLQALDTTFDSAYVTISATVQ